MYMDAEPRPDLLGGAYITGHAGVGKTHAACGAIRAFVERHVKEIEGMQLYTGSRAKFVSAPAWFAQMRATYGRRGESEQDVFDRYARCGLLVLDDLGKGSKTDWAVERIYMLLDYRSTHKLPTIITSNYDLGEVASILSTDEQSKEAIASRISGMCRGVRMSGQDRRLKNSRNS
jgi:DNA replication protein DnaC/primosomal protein DnaI